MPDDINSDLKDENIEITASALTHPDDDEVDEEAVPETAAVDPELDEFASDGEDDELETDKMDFEPEDKDLL